MPSSDSAESPSVTATAGLSASVAVLYLLLRLLAVADWNWNTAGAVADTVDFGDSVSIVFGTLFARPEITGVLVALLLPLVVLNSVWPLSGRARQVSLSAVFSIAALVAATCALVLTFGQWWVPAGSAAVAAVVVGVRLARRRGLAHDAVTFLLRSVGAVALLGVLALAAVVDTPWMSREHIDTTTGTIDGYVLEAEPGFLKILTADDRDFLIVETADVRSRELAD